MATPIRRILVAIRDLHHPPHKELRKAAQVARAAKASVELFHAADIPARADRVAAALRAGEVAQLALTKIGNAERRLQQFSRLALFRGLKLTCHSNADYPPHEAIIRRAITVRADLVIAATRPHRLLRKIMLQNTDWELIRQCPCPLLLVKSGRSYANSTVLAAVDPFHAHAKPVGLDARVLDSGNSVARLFNGSLHMLHVYAPLVSIAPMPAVVAAPVGIPPEVEAAHARMIANELTRLATPARVPPTARHLRMGVVADELCVVAKATHACLVVMGAVSRSALRRIFIGSTAENALDKLPCDVLVVKPRGFKSSVSVRPPSRSGKKAA